ncbi:MAG TPA: tRNA (adenosine(37)-N6)-threonylcarbamoyltransferase complex ATPase subunit type 1 TsaE [Candidatus Veblenbacteria bacterium]|nr:tRNA (adenosine(37)-N6)-threonylcarbamoyltransferase complex ATPase subunit type 1 TsaE [Candidatus Veblenbacteria bacterium]
MKGQKFISKSAAQTKLLGIKLAKQLNGNEVIALVGNLGSGKTTFVKGLAKGLGVKDVITSPTFVLMKNYKAKHKTIKNFVHVDCYRLPAGRHGVPGIELTAIGLGDFLNQADTVVAIEWAEKLPKKFKPTIKLNFGVGKKPSERSIGINE